MKDVQTCYFNGCLKENEDMIDAETDIICSQTCYLFIRNNILFSSFYILWVLIFLFIVIIYMNSTIIFNTVVLLSFSTSQCIKLILCNQHSGSIFQPQDQRLCFLNLCIQSQLLSGWRRIARPANWKDSRILGRWVTTSLHHYHKPIIEKKSKL